MTNAAQKLNALLKREAAIKKALRAEKAKRRDREEQDRERLKAIIGNALLQDAEQYPDFDLMIRSVLKTTIKPGSSEFNFLKTKGWLQ
jgi:hypothetical protein